MSAPSPPPIVLDEPVKLKLDVLKAGIAEFLSPGVGEENDDPKWPREGPELPAPVPNGGGELDAAAEGVLGFDCGIAGNDSSKDAPNEDVGLNA